MPVNFFNSNTTYPDTHRCPLCGLDNHCANVRQQETGVQQEPCWCSHTHFDAALLARVPEPARNKACVCACCAGAASGVQN